MQLGYSAAGLIMVEATAVEKIGRIIHNCVGIYDDKRIVSIKKSSISKISCTQKIIFWNPISTWW